MDELVENLLTMMRQRAEINRALLAEAVGADDNEPMFRLAFSAARNRLVIEGIDFQPIGGLLYRRATPLATLQRGRNDIRAGLLKFGRATAKAELAAQSEDPRVRQSAQRQAERASLLTATGRHIARTGELPRTVEKKS